MDRRLVVKKKMKLRDTQYFNDRDLINKYVKKGDLLILISSSGKSKNMLNAIKIAKLKKIYKVVTFTGFEKNNPLKIRGDLNFWVDSRKYNFIENIHQFWLLMIVDILKANNKN